MRAVWFLEVAGHFCEEFIAGYADVYGESQPAGDLLPDVLSQRFRSIPVPGGQEVCDVEPGLIDRDLLKDRCDFREDLHQTAGIFPVGGKIRRDEDQVGALLQGFYYRLSGADPVLFCRNGFGCYDPVARFDIASDSGRDRAQIHTSRRKAQLFQSGP